MTKPTDRALAIAREFFAVPGGRDYRDITYLACLLAAAREEGRQEERARCRSIIEQWEAFDGRWRGRPMHEVDIQFRILHEIGTETGTQGGEE